MPRSVTRERTPRAAKSSADELVRARIEVAQRALQRDRLLTGKKTHRVSGRIDPGLVRAAMERSGIRSETALVEAALTLLAEPDDYALWLISQRGQLDKEFELAL
jgi:hypothetical protein